MRWDTIVDSKHNVALKNIARNGTRRWIDLKMCHCDKACSVTQTLALCHICNPASIKNSKMQVPETQSDGVQMTTGCAKIFKINGINERI